MFNKQTAELSRNATLEPKPPKREWEGGEGRREGERVGGKDGTGRDGREGREGERCSHDHRPSHPCASWVASTKDSAYTTRLSCCCEKFLQEAGRPIGMFLSVRVETCRRLGPNLNISTLRILRSGARPRPPLAGSGGGEQG